MPLLSPSGQWGIPNYEYMSLVVFSILILPFFSSAGKTTFDQVLNNQDIMNQQYTRIKCIRRIQNKTGSNHIKWYDFNNVATVAYILYTVAY